MNRKMLALAAGLSLLGHPSTATAFEEAASVASSAEAPVLRGTLANGLRYEIRPSDKGTGRAVLGFVVKAGVSQATREQTEYPHLAEHLILETARSEDQPGLKGFELFAFWAGAEAPPQHRLVRGQTLEMGVRLLPVIDLRRAPGLVAPLKLFRSYFDYDPSEADIAMAARSVLAEIGSDADLLRIDSDISRQLGFDEPGIDAAMASLRGVTKEKLGAFYSRYYRPDLTTIYVSGDVDPRTIERTIAAIFSPVVNVGPTPAMARNGGPDPRLAVATATAGHFAKVDIAIRIGQAAGAPPTPFDDPDFQKRLQIIIDRRLGQLYRHYGADMDAAASAIVRRPRGGGSDLELTVGGCRPDKIKSCLGDIFRSLFSLERYGPTDAELRFVENGTARSASPDNVADERDLLEQVTREALDADIARSPVVAAFDAASVMRALRDLFSDQRITIDVRGPPSLQPLAEAEVEAIMLASRKGAAPPAEGARALSLPEAPRLAPAALAIDWEELALARVAKVRSESGVLHILFPTGPSPGSAIRILAASAGRSGETAFSEAQIRHGVDLVRNQGLGGLDRFQFADLLAEKHVEVSQSSSGGQSTISLGVEKVADVPLAADIIAAAFDVDEVRQDALPDFLRQSGSDLGPDALGAARDLVSAYRSVFSAPTDFIYVVTGDLDADGRDQVLRDLASRLLSKRPTRDPFAAAETAMTTGKRDPIPDAPVDVLIHWTIAHDERPSFDALVDSRVTAVLQMRIYNRLRGKEGDVYTPLASVSTRILPPVDAGGVRFDTDAHAAARLIDATLEELQAFRTAGPTDREWAQLLAPLPDAALGAVTDVQLLQAYISAKGDAGVLRDLRQTVPDRAAILRKLATIPSSDRIDVNVTPR